MLVDDDEFTNHINVKVIEKAKIDTHVQVTGGAEEALEYLKKAGPFSNVGEELQPGLILLDLNMPGMNGWDFLDEYETISEERKSGIVIAVLTSSNHPIEQEKLMKNANVAVFWTKPLKADALIDLVESHFQQNQDDRRN